MEAWFSTLFNGGSFVALLASLLMQYHWYSFGNEAAAMGTSSNGENYFLVLIPLIVLIGTTVAVFLPQIPSSLFQLCLDLCGCLSLWDFMSIASAGIVRCRLLITIGSNSENTVEL